jgi:DNA topoisomerase-1
MARGLVTDDLRLTSKGQRWRDASPEVLLDPRVSAAIERYCEKFPPSMMDDPDREPWELVASRITGALPPAVREPMEALIRHEAPRPKSNPIRDYGLDRNFAEEAAQKALPDHAYAPTLD